jgi:hypothetical protein
MYLCSWLYIVHFINSVFFLNFTDEWCIHSLTIDSSTPTLRINLNEHSIYYYNVHEDYREDHLQDMIPPQSYIVETSLVIDFSLV